MRAETKKILYLIPAPEYATPFAGEPAEGKSRGGLCLFFLAGLAVVAGYEALVNTAHWSVQTRVLATFVMVLGAVPALVYLRAGRFRTIPFFEGHCLFYSLSFGYAGFRPLFGMVSLTTASESYLQDGLIAAMVCLFMLMIGFYGLGAEMWRNVRQFSLHMPDSNETTPRLLIGEVIAWAGLEVVQKAGAPGIQQITEIMRTFVFVHFIVCQYLGLLPRWGRLFFWSVFVPWILLVGSNLVNGRLNGIIMFSIWLTMAQLWAKGRISVKWLAFAGFVVLLFQPVKVMYRMDIWNNDQYTTLQKVDLFFNALKKQNAHLKTEHDKQTAFEEAFSRINQLELTACVIRDTPSAQPYQYGQTYLPLLTKWIPRIVWPDKPVEDLGNRWGRRYGYLDASDFATSLNLPWLTEMFINFGRYGVLVIPLLIGILFRWLWQKLARAPLNSVDLSLGVALLSREILVESHFSMMLGDIIVGFVSLVSILWAIQNFSWKPAQ